CVYGALRAGDEQVSRVEEYVGSRHIPVYYGLYNPLTLPTNRQYPELDGILVSGANDIGCRVMSFPHIKTSLDKLKLGDAARFNDLLSATPFDPADASSTFGWRLERFIAD